jgi:hypothetical protein
MSNFVRRQYYTTAEPPEPTGAHIDGRQSLTFGVPHLPMPHLPWTEFWKPPQDDMTAAADGGTGFFNAWGRGLPDWDETPDDDVTGETALEDLLGVFPGVWAWVEPDVIGDIIFSDGSRWTLSIVQTAHVYIESFYDEADEPGEAIREVASYFNVAADPGHESDPYIIAGDIADLGELAAMDRIPIESRSAETSGKVRFIISWENP